MERILIIEPSATLRHILTKFLAGQGYDPEVAHTFEAGHGTLREPRRDGSGYGTVIVGWPTHTDPDADELISLLEEPPYRELPVLVVAHEPGAAMRTWVGQRPNTAFILWDNHQEVTESIKRLVRRDDAPIVSSRMSPARLTRIRVLLVDDSPSIRVYYRRLLGRHDYVTDTAASVDEALEMTERNTYDIAIIDYFMPDANGDMLCRKLGENPDTAGIITAILTGTYSDQVIRDCLEAGAVECMFKNEAEELFLARLAAMSRLAQAAKSIEAERQRLEGILTSVGDGVYGVSKDGHITFINPVAKQILGYSGAADLTGESPHSLFHYAGPDGEHNPAEQCVLNQSYGGDTELRCWETVFWHFERKPIPVECTVYPLRIQERVEGSVIAFRDISERKSLEEKLRWQATHDPLTELLNRRYFEEQLEAEVGRLKRYCGECSALLHVDLDRFKYINDTAGHSTGDRLLVEVGRLLRSRLRETDTLARMGGDEFAVLLRRIHPDDIFQVADSFREILSEREFHCNGSNFRLNVSVGVATIDADTQSPGEVLANADIACMIAKRRGRNQTHAFVAESDERLAMDMDLGWSTRLRRALETDGLVLHYQPILSLQGLNTRNLPDQEGELWRHARHWHGDAQHFEVLVRLRGDHGEIISPSAFIPTAERFNMMQEIDFWVLDHAVRALAEFNRGGGQAVFSVNLSGQTLADERLLPTVTHLLDHHRVDASSLIFEVTETAAISCLESAKQLISALKDMGCRFALDDFGSGFSSFSHLKHLPVDIIKIDGAFVQGMARDPIDRAMVASMNDIAHSLGRVTIAEYAEDAEILKLLKECGVDYAQGFYVCRPLSSLKQALSVYEESL